MGKIKNLAGQAVLYGLSNIIPRVLNYLLVPLYTRIFDPHDFGIITELYAYVTFLIILLTLGLETGFFRFLEKENKNNVFVTATTILFFSAILFCLLVFVFASNIANALQYQNHIEYIKYFAIILSLDVMVAVPFARLRAEEKALKFAALKILNVVFNICLNLFFFLLIPYLLKNGNKIFFITLYNPDVGVGYVFIANIFSSLLMLLIMLPSIIKTQGLFDFRIAKNLLSYSLPLMIAGMAGNINEAMDRVLLKHLLPNKEIAMQQLGIYGATLKIAILMVLFTQMFRYAFEPFFFKNASSNNSKQTLADIMKYFCIFILLIFMGVAMFIDVVKYIIGEEFRSALHIVPILLFSYVFYGLTINLSAWYKLTDKTHFGAYITFFGAGLTIILSILFIPLYSYVASAWIRLICYGSMAIISYWLNQRYYKIPYDIKAITKYILLALIVYVIADYVKLQGMIKYLFNGSLIFFYLFIVESKEKILHKLLNKKIN